MTEHDAWNFAEKYVGPNIRDALVGSAHDEAARATEACIQACLSGPLRGEAIQAGLVAAKRVANETLRGSWRFNDVPE
jgi:hypothetical protein